MLLLKASFMHSKSSLSTARNLRSELKPKTRFRSTLIRSIQDKIKQFIQKNSISRYVIGGMLDEQIKFIEQRLNVSLSDDYKWFLKKLWHVWYLWC